MSMHVVGVKPPDQKWRAMKAVWDACEEARIPVPPEVRAFFGHDKPDGAGVVVELQKTNCCKGWEGGGERSGYEVDVTKLPPDVKVVRFYCSW